MTISDSAVGDLETLRAVVAGGVFMLGEAGYDEARRVWNLAVDERPAVVVQAESAADVGHALRCARARGRRIAAHGTGHGAGPLESLEGAMLVRTSRMRSVRIDPVSRTARAEAGAVWRDVTVPADAHGLAALEGIAPDVGVTGYVLGGGIGCFRAATGWPQTASPPSNSSPPKAGSCAPTPTTSRICSGRCAVVAAASGW